MQHSCLEFADVGIERGGFEGPHERVASLRGIDDCIDPEERDGLQASSAIIKYTSVGLECASHPIAGGTKRLGCLLVRGRAVDGRNFSALASNVKAELTAMMDGIEHHGPKHFAKWHLVLGAIFDDD